MANVVAEEISVAGKTAKKTNVFWSTVPESEQFRNVRVPGVTSGSMENSKTYSKVQPQVLVRKSKSEPVVASNRDVLISGNNRKATGRMSNRKNIPPSRAKDDIQGKLTESMVSLPEGDSRRASIKNLNVEDKKRVANLIKELAKTGEERELALERLQEERVTFEERLAVVQEEQASLRLEKEVLQQKLKHGELQLKKYESDLENLKQYKKNQDLILKKQSAALAQGTQTSPLPRVVSSSSTSPLNSGKQCQPNLSEGHTKSPPNWDANHNFVPSSVHVTSRSPKGNHVSSEVPQVPVYANRLFDVKISKTGQPVKPGAGGASEENVREESHLHELYLREYKLQLDLQEKQLEIQRQQVVLQQQLNLLHQQQKQPQQPQPMKAHLSEEPVYHNAQQTNDVQSQQKQSPSYPSELNNNVEDLKLTSKKSTRANVQHNQGIDVSQGNHPTSQKRTRVGVSQDQVIYQRNLGYTSSTAMSKNQMLSNEQGTEHQQLSGHPTAVYLSQSVEGQDYYQNTDNDQSVDHRNSSYSTSHHQSRIKETTGDYDQPSIPLRPYHGNPKDQYYHQHGYSEQPRCQLKNKPHLAENNGYHHHDDYRDMQNLRSKPALHKVTNKGYTRTHNQPLISQHIEGVQVEEYQQNPSQSQALVHSWPSSHNNSFTENEEQRQVAENFEQNFSKYNEHRNLELRQSQNNFQVLAQSNNHYRENELSHGKYVPSTGRNPGYQRQHHMQMNNQDEHAGMEPQEYLPKSIYHSKQLLGQKHYHNDSLYHDSQLSSTTNHRSPEQQDHSRHYPSIDTYGRHPQEVHLSSNGVVPSVHHPDSDQPYNDHYLNTENFVSEPYGKFRHGNQAPGQTEHSHPDDYCSKCSGPCCLSYSHEDFNHKQRSTATGQNALYRQPTNTSDVSHHTIAQQNRLNFPHYNSELHPDRCYQQNDQLPQQKKVGFTSVLVTDKPEHGNGPSRHVSLSRSEKGSQREMQDGYSGRRVPLDRYISHHEQSVGRNLQNSLTSENNSYKGTPSRKIASKCGELRQLDPRVQGGIREEHELGQDEMVDSRYSLYRPESSCKSPVVSQSPNPRHSPSVSRQLQVKPSRQSYPNSLIEFVEDLESSTSEWDEPGPRQKRTSFVSSDEEESSVLDNIFFLKR